MVLEQSEAMEESFKEALTPLFESYKLNFG